MIYEFKIDPVAKPRMTAYSHRSAFSPPAKKYWAYKDQLCWLAKQLKYKIDDNLCIAFQIPMPKSWSKKKKEAMKNQPHQQKPDLKNLVAAFEDALSDKDQTIWQYDISKHWGKTGKIIVVT